MKNDSDLAPLHRDPRFQALRNRGLRTPRPYSD
ncbi:hypothetical protein [Sinorhizobium fredii]